VRELPIFVVVVVLFMNSLLFILILFYLRLFVRETPKSPDGVFAPAVFALKRFATKKTSACALARASSRTRQLSHAPALARASSRTRQLSHVAYLNCSAGMFCRWPPELAVDLGRVCSINPNKK
jgi:hypothetical protein